MPAAFDNASSAASTTSSSTLSWNHTCSGSSRALVVFVGQDNGATRVPVSGVTYNGVAMTPLTAQGTSVPSGQLFYLLNPAAGSNQVFVTMSSSIASFSATAVSCSGVASVGHQNGTWGTSSNPATAVVSAAGNIVVDGLLYSISGHLTGSNQTLRVSQTNSQSNVYSSTAPGAASVNMNYSSSTPDAFAICAVELVGTPAGNGGHGGSVLHEIKQVLNVFPGWGKKVF